VVPLVGFSPTALVGAQFSTILPLQQLASKNHFFPFVHSPMPAASGEREYEAGKERKSINFVFCK